MDVGNLARVFGPTIVGHSVPNPDPMTILQDTKRQPKVGQTKKQRNVKIKAHLKAGEAETRCINP